MGLFLVELVGLVMLAFVRWRRGPEPRVSAVRSARWLRLAALIVLGLQGLLFVVFAAGEIVGGDWSGAGHLLQLAPVVALGWLVWSRPLETGVVLLLSGVLYGLMTLAAVPVEPGAVRSMGVVLLAGPHVVAGVLALLAGLAARARKA